MKKVAHEKARVVIGASVLLSLLFLSSCNSNDSLGVLTGHVVSEGELDTDPGHNRFISYTTPVKERRVVTFSLNLQEAILVYFQDEYYAYLLPDSECVDNISLEGSWIVCDSVGVKYDVRTGKAFDREHEALQSIPLSVELGEVWGPAELVKGD